MEHDDWEWSPDGEAGSADSAASADTADLGGDGDLGDLSGPDLTGHDLGGFDDYSDHLHAPDLGGDAGDLSGHDLGGHGVTPGDGLDEPLGTEHATDHFDDAVNDLHDDATDGPDAYTDGPDGPDGPGGPDDAGDPDDGRPEALVGADPDLPPGADDPGWHDHAFPPELGITDPPEPVDGFPWSDPSTLGADGTHDDYTHLAGDHGAPPVNDLAQYAGIDVPPGTDAWSALLGSDDPATSTLARWWIPGT
jgi:hypothetical protein